ncbi:MAG: hypothetical protein GX638_13215 [Crenarchaeota archaeon]|nr:hypothetical protein [Thermoproteota archaeon]
MDKTSKTFASMLTLIISISCLTLLTMKPADAQTIPKPSVPEFTIQSQTHANTTTIILTIRNQPFDTASQYPNGFFYNVAMSVDGKNWSNFYHVEDASDWYPQQSNSSTTVLIYVAGETMYYPMNSSQAVGIIPKSGEVAFKVQAMIGHRDRGAFQNGFMPYVLVGEESDWSNSQIINIMQSPTPSSSNTPMPTSFPSKQPTEEPPESQPQPFSTTLIVTAFIAAAVVIILGLLYFKKRRR